MLNSARREAAYPGPARGLAAIVKDASETVGSFKVTPGLPFFCFSVSTAYRMTATAAPLSSVRLPKC